MTLRRLEVRRFRNLDHLELECSPRLNLITGANASGKTSVLEAIFFLSRARSFRTANPRELIAREVPGSAHGHETGDLPPGSFRVVATLAAGGRRSSAGVERGARVLNARLDGQPVRSLSELARRLPVLLIDPDSHRLLQDGPGERRRFLDWGTFQQETGFMPAWRRFRAALRQRNALLRGAGSTPDARAFSAWEQEMVAAAGALDTMRGAYLSALKQSLEPFLGVLLDGVGEGRVELDYRRGWPQGRDLGQWLAQSRAQDRQYGHTRAGPHRADFRVRLALGPGRPLLAAEDYLSRGQQKLLVIALTLAQASVYGQGRDGPADRSCLLLVDDLPAELDRRHLGRVMDCLAGQPLQLFVTAIDRAALERFPGATDETRVFTLSNGQAEKMV